jgi:hypothetical protein
VPPRLRLHERSRPVTNVTIKPRADEKFDIYVHSDEGEPLLNSSQGYSRAVDAETTVRNLFSGIGAEQLKALRDIVSQAEAFTTVEIPYEALLNDLRSVLTAAASPEPVHLTIEYLDGHVRTEQLR